MEAHESQEATSATSDIECDGGIVEVDVDDQNFGDSDVEQDTFLVHSSDDDGDDVEEDLSDQPPSHKRARKTRGSAGDINERSFYDPGETDGLKFEMWPNHYIKKIQAKPPLLQQLMTTLMALREIELVTDFSGSCGAEQAAHLLRFGILELAGVTTVFKALRSCDSDPTCQKVALGLLDTAEKPQRVHRDIIDRLAGSELEDMLAICTRWMESRNLQMETLVKDPNHTKKQLQDARMKSGRSMVADLYKYASAIDFSERYVDCLRHGKCKISPERKDEAVRIYVLGHRCDNWSAFGKRCGWVPLDSILFVVAMVSNLQVRPEYVIAE